MSAEDIEHRFSHHPPLTTRKRCEHGSVRFEFRELAVWLDKHLPDGREKALAITKLEEAMFWSNAAVARAAND